jgi:predicted aspartyl protease/tetratricopeptide (TPR) repeat protein
MNALRAAACAALFSWAAAAQANCRIQVMQLPVHMEGSRAIATLGINGTQIPMMVDSGAFFSILTRASAEQLGLRLDRLPDGIRIEGLAGNMVSPRKTRVKTVQLQGAELHDIEFLVGGNDSGMGAMGIIGRNILGVLDVEYDLAHGMVRLVKPGDGCDKANMAYWADEQPVSQVDLLPNRFDVRPPIRAKVQLNGHEVTAMFDTGAGTLVSLEAAHKAGLKDADLRDRSVSYGIGEGHVKAWTGDFDSVALGGETVSHNRLGVSDFDAHDFDMLMGIDFFLSHRIYVSMDRSRMFFTYNGGPVFARNVEANADRASAPASQVPDALSAEDLYRRGTASLARKDDASALADLDRACALEPGKATFHLARAEANAKLNNLTRSMADLDTALALDPGLDDARLIRAALRARAADQAPALQDLAFLDASLPAQSNMRRALAEAYDDLHAPIPSIKQWTLWIDHHRDDVRLPAAHNSRCWARVEANIELDKAMDDCDDAIDEESDDAGFRDSRGWLQLRLNQPAKAKADFDRAIKLKPTAAFSFYGRALARTKLGETAAAQADLATARQAQPKIDQWVKNDGLEVAP